MPGFALRTPSHDKESFMHPFLQAVKDRALHVLKQCTLSYDSARRKVTARPYRPFNRSDKRPKP